MLEIADVVDESAAPMSPAVRTATHPELGDAQWVFYTLGTSGLPKGARHRDSGLVAPATGMAEHMAMSERDRSGIAFPIAHIGGPINFMAALVTGTTLILIEHFDPVATAEVLARGGRHHGRVGHGVPPGLPRGAGPAAGRAALRTPALLPGRRGAQTAGLAPAGQSASWEVSASSRVGG